ncbi:uncharacterized protein LAESUDRAFT_347041 [Laetiporus sulphureus 93-53]|uniref:F-box domain-containing protein n=1 Tax=Laetiporus sulphureus 93-53 TaxID=1314785 RepID=A0A165GS93_9APHY|nr:uncharacterized protein LAESUDRAFT_347041 [Laetiporus sulphureus 93-53]KZT10737.1 hypothetical protein LAESUDRAFT_347041 [Laetiporus sulphureus 93-53]
MHHVLLLNELLLQLLQVLCEDDLRALAVLARTCLSFSQPALEILWESLDNPSPVVQLFPDDSWTVAYHLYSRKRCLVRAVRYLALSRRLLHSRNSQGFSIL